MFVEAILFSLIIGIIRGGKLKNFKGVNQKTLWMLIIGILMQYILVFLNRIEQMKIVNDILSYTKIILIFSYILILIGIFTNIKFKSLWAVLVGFILNLLVMIANGWKMPILLEGVNLIGFETLYELIEKGKSSFYVAIGENIKYSILGDIIIFANPYPIARIISIGDIIISFGIFAFIQEVMLRETSFIGGYRW
ncbi:hypothetical protein EDD65_10196 [Keratinibaculum paraultunense]|uniref:DUF5317 domain-containing protein n=1 Tax=Keratinibaculum paraultunense TaxID=1278232 RepID=A0A4R3KZ44_9FIRM|nr:DUF5317 family protein [Keratinibaculum paraultunense]QQY80085.1 DUF5317 domain-containing protein [Keratinibaculum paraultunense]TCS91594.1 hypothetical protein EDD65_10196 [Keratinibaculum paraultunense]